MIDDIQADAEERMEKSLEALGQRACAEACVDEDSGLSGTEKHGVPGAAASQDGDLQGRAFTTLGRASPRLLPKPPPRCDGSQVSAPDRVCPWLSRRWRGACPG